MGNNRLVYADLNNDGTINPANEIVEENNYYPFGLQHQGYNDIANSCRNEEAEAYKYNGKEYEDALGLNMYEMDLRQYDPAIGRWTVMDPVTHHDYSPYSAFDNNPVYWSDPSGANSVRYNWGSGDYDVLDGDGKWVGSFDPGMFGDYQSNPEEFLQNFFSLEAPTDEANGGDSGDGNGGGKGKGKGKKGTGNNGKPTYNPAYKELPGFPGSKKLPKGKGQRVGWKLPNGDIAEWDSAHGEVEIYDRTGNTHKGAYDPDTGEKKSEGIKGRRASRAKFDVPFESTSTYRNWQLSPQAPVTPPPPSAYATGALIIIMILLIPIGI